MKEELRKAFDVLRNYGYQVYQINQNLVLLVKQDKSDYEVEETYEIKEEKSKIDISDPKIKRLMKKLNSIDKDKRALLWKISMIYYKDRSIDKLKDSLSKEEMLILKDLIDSKYVMVNSDGKISLPKEVYEMTKLMSYIKMINELEYGILEIEDIEMFKNREDIDQFIVFNNPIDSKFYVIKRELFDKNKDKVLRSIKIPTHIDKIAEKTGLPSQMVKIILVILAEAGECVEDSTDTYRRVV